MIKNIIFSLLLSAVATGAAIAAEPAAEKSKPATPPPATEGKAFTPPAASHKSISPEEMVEAMMKNIDKDGDGKVNLAEFLEAPTRAFKDRDKNSDGFLDKKEFMPQNPMGTPPKKN